MKEVLMKSALFKGISEEELDSLIKCVGFRRIVYSEGNIIFSHGDIIREVGFVLKGSVQVVREDFWGNRSIISQLERGDFFGEVYAALEERKMANTVIAAQRSEILFFDCGKILSLCHKNCVFHQKLISNFIRVIAEKNIMLMEKITHISQRSTREKVLSFLSSQAEKSGGRYFTIPFSRQEMADYLSVDRSALSKELSRMKAEKIIDYDKNSFRLL